MRKEIPKFLRSDRGKRTVLALVVATALTAAIGFTRASTSFYSVEPENSTISGAASVQTDSAASGGKYILFGQAASTPTPDPTPTPTPGTGLTAVTGTAYYVDCNGNDSSDGKTANSAWKSLSKANSVSLSAGDGILFKKGCSWSGNLTVKWSGTSSKPVVIGAYGSGNAPTITRNTNGADITVTGSYTVIQELNLTASAPKTDPSCNNNPVGNIQGVSYEAGSSYNVVKNSTISNMYAGVFLKSDAHHNSIINNKLVNNNMMSPLDTSADNDAGAFGVLIWGHDNEIANNTISGSNACSYDYTLDGAAVEIFGGSSVPTSNNRIHHNKAINTNAFTELGKSSSGAIPNNNVYAYNTYFASGISNAIFMVTRGDTGKYGPINGTKAYNNTAYMTGTTKNGLYCGTCSATALTFKNNIIATNNNTPIPSNLGSGTSNNLGWVIGSSTNNPNFVNAGGQDFHLNSSSPAINKGISDSLTAQYTTDLDGKKVPAGGALDIGAYEYGAVATANQKKTVSFENLANSVIRKVSNTLNTSIKSIGGLFGKLFKTEKVEAVQANGSIVIAAVGDMNPDGNTSKTNAAGKNATAITSGLANGSLDAFFALGDYQYQHGGCGSSSGGNWDYVKYWASLYGSAIPKTYTIAGPTHDTTGASDDTYKKFFAGQCPGSTAKSAAVASQGGQAIDALDFYSFDIGKWHFAALPTAAWRFDSTKGNAITAQLDADLAKAKAAGKHLAALYHDPYFTGVTDSHGPETKVKPWIDVLDKYGVRLTLSGSQHNYERTCPVNKSGVCQTDGTGMTAFNVSTGGIGLRTFKSSPGFVVRYFTDTHGWLKLTLNPDGSFSWLFNSVNGPGTDSGSRAGPGGGGGTTPTPTPSTDTTPPVVAISSPTTNQSVAGTIQIKSTATDNSGSIKKVDLLVDGTTTATKTLTSAPYNFDYDTKSLPNGNHTFTVNAYDNTNNVGTAKVQVSINNADCQSVPTTYGTVTSSINLATTGKYRVWSRIKAPDSNNNSYYLVIDNQCPVNVGDSAIGANSWTWVDNKDGGSTVIDLDLPAGTHTVKMIGRESGVQLDRVLFISDLGCTPTGTGDNCSVSSDTVAPTISITSPTPDQKLKGSIAIAVNAKDNNAVAKVEYYLDAAATVPFATSTSSPFGVTWDSALASAGSHTIRAIAYDGVGNKSTEATVAVTITDQAKPTVSITSPTAGNISGISEIKIDANDNVAVTKVDVKLDNTTTLSSLTTPPYYLAWDSKNSTDGQHNITALAYDAEGNVGVSQPINITVVNDKTVPSAPTNLKTTQISTSSVSLAWDASTDDTGVTGYNIYRGGAFITSTTETKFVDQKIQPNTIYTYTVSASDAANNESLKSSPLVVTIPALENTTTPDAPENVSSETSGTSVNLKWNAVSGSTKYLIQRDGLIIGETTETSYSDTHVLPGKTYVYVVYASSSTGVLSLASGSTTITTQTVTDNEAPNPPRDLSFTLSPNLVNLTWTAATDNVGVAEYVVYRDGQFLGKTTNPGFGDGTVDDNKTYTYYVIAVDANGNESQSSSEIKVSIPDHVGTIKSGVIADTFVQKNKSSQNFGNWQSIRVDKSPRQNLLIKFNVQGTKDKVITSAKLRLYAHNGSTRTGGYVYALKSNNWEEDKVTWSNSPGIDENLIYKLGRVSKNSYVDVDLSKLIKGDGTYSIVFTSTSRDAAHYNSKESGSKQPELIITTN